LALAIDYIKRHAGMTINAYLRQYGIEASSSSFLDEESAKTLGSSTDGYTMDLLTAIKMNLKEIKQRVTYCFTNYRIFYLFFIMIH